VLLTGDRGTATWSIPTTATPGQVEEEILAHALADLCC
jgi:hypothetical protein